jgi:hypothetical protein
MPEASTPGIFLLYMLSAQPTPFVIRTTINNKIIWMRLSGLSEQQGGLPG